LRGRRGRFGVCAVNRSSTNDSAPDWVIREIRVGGLAGGHSGMQIQEPLANAIQLAGQLLRVGRDAAPTLRIVSIDGGTAHNAIPRDCRAFVVVAANQLNAFNSALDMEFLRINAAWRAHEPALHLANHTSTNELAPLEPKVSDDWWIC
jgi:dipeptidase D